MIRKEQINTEIRIGKVIVDETGNYLIEEYDKDENLIDEITIDDLLEIYADKRYVRIRIDYLRDI